MLHAISTTRGVDIADEMRELDRARHDPYFVSPGNAESDEEPPQAPELPIQDQLGRPVRLEECATIW